jgi:hypothetical protein
MIKTRYFHLRCHEYVCNCGDCINPKGGATVMVSPAIDPDVVFVTRAYCSFEDNFTRKGGREAAGDKLIEMILLKDLPKYLLETSYRVYRNRGCSRTNARYLSQLFTDYEYAVKFFQPKPV